ncbi:MAG: hypothetical protein PF517_05550 [Salinivirgaceae bacterium]|jgi:ferric-dicitrate binding protein FerR (iron transport regulator)|nr:hypothetical protein [Salinivirgaceae bacterium]
MKQTNDILLEKILSKTATSVEKDEFHTWINASDGNKQQFEKTKIVWEKLNNIYINTVFDKVAAKEKILEKIKNPEKTIKLALQSVLIKNLN